MKTITFGKTTYIVEPGRGSPTDAVDPIGLSAKAQVDLCNLVASITGAKRTKVFKDKATGASRVCAALISWEAKMDAEESEAPGDPATPAPPAEPATAPATGGVNFLGMRGDLPPMPEIRPFIRQDTAVTRLHALLIRDQGATEEELVSTYTALDAERGRTTHKRSVRTRLREALNCLNQHWGYGVVTLADGKTLKLTLGS